MGAYDTDSINSVVSRREEGEKRERGEKRKKRGKERVGEATQDKKKKGRKDIH